MQHVIDAQTPVYAPEKPPSIAGFVSPFRGAARRRPAGRSTGGVISLPDPSGDDR